MTHWRLAAALLAVALGGAACSKVQAKAPGPMPEPLVAPDPPARQPIPVPTEPPPQPPPTERPPAPATSKTPPRPTSTPAPTNPPPTNPPAETGPPPVVQTADQSSLENRATKLLADAKRDLDKVRYQSLGRDAQEQYNSAQRFVKMTTDALSARNFVFAASCAEKAATLAALLIKR